jgi:tripartite-type tricarboxylate transporter receptor subunit TctC
MAGELLKTMAGIDILHVPHRAAGDARTAVIAGHVEMMFDAITTMAPLAQAHQVRALGTTATTRSKVMPDVPTIAEAGVPGFEATIWLALMAPARTPKPIIDKLNAAINNAIASQTFKDRFALIGDEPAGGTPEEFAELIRADSAKWGEVVRRSGARLD